MPTDIFKETFSTLVNLKLTILPTFQVLVPSYNTYRFSWACFCTIDSSLCGVLLCLRAGWRLGLSY